MGKFDKNQSGAVREKKSKELLQTLAYRFGSILLMVFIWQIISLLVSTKYIPGPWGTWLAMVDLFKSGEMRLDYIASLFRILSSFAGCMLLGLVVGVVMGLNRKAERMFDLWIMVGITIPGLCYIVVAFMWLGLNDKAGILAITMATFPTIAINIWQGVKSIDQRMVDMARSFQATSWRRTVRVILPQVYPYVMAAIRFGLGIIWKVTVLVEMLGLSNGIGYKISYSFQLMNMANVFAWTLSFVILMIIIELGIFAPLERRLFSWRPEIRS